MEKQHLTAGALDTAGALVSFRKGCLTSSIGWVGADMGGRVDVPADVPLGADEEDVHRDGRRGRDTRGDVSRCL